ncbi:MAG: glycosyltransferase, partial [Anaerolineae bacterium]|nr:glycosyltransferase [Anaerolineae bacterium]
MIVLNDMTYDGRVRAEAAALVAAGWRVLVIGTQRADGSLPDRETIRGFDLWRVRYGRYGARLWRPWRWFRHGFQATQVVRTVLSVRARAYHAHDFPALILLSLARILHRGLRGRRVVLVYDAHELYLFQGQYTSRLVRAWHRLTLPLFAWVEGALARRADAVIGLSAARGRFLARWYGIPRPVIVFNTLDPVGETADSPIDLRAVVGTGRRIVVHTGDITDQGRCLTELVTAVAQLLDDVALVFLGRGDEEKPLRQLAKTLGIGQRVFFVPPVPPEQVPATICVADVAVALLRPDSYNIRASIPNKLWEAVAAGVPVV